MPGMDGTGPMGYGPMTGGRRGSCAGGTADPGRGFGASAGTGRGRGGGFGRRNQFYATGLTGWQRAEQGAAQPAQAAAQADPLTRIEGALKDVLDRLERLEAAGKE